MEAKALFAKPVLWPLATMLIAALLLVGVTGSAAAGTGNKGANASGKPKCKKGPKAGAKASATNGKKGKPHRKCRKRKPAPPMPTPPATPPVTPPAPPVTPPASPVTPPVTPPAVATLAITPTSFDFGDVQHGGIKPCKAEGDPTCKTFTVTNTGTGTSGVPVASIVEIRTPEIGEHPAAFVIMANTCNTALPPGATCALTVKFSPNSNAGDMTFESRLDVTASPGNTVSSTLSGMAD